MSEKTTEFEEGKQVEEYFNPEEALKELDSLPLETEPEKAPEGHPLENVVEVIEKPQKKKKEQQPQPIIAPQPSPAKPPQEPAPQEKPSPASQEQSIPEQQPQLEPQQQFFLGIDNYIQKQSEQIEQEYVKQGKLVSQQFRENSYRNLVAVITCRVRLVPVEQQPQPESQQQPTVDKPIVDNTEAIRQIDAMLKDPSLKDIRKALLKRKCDLLGVEFSDDLVPANSVSTQPPQSQHEPPVNPKVVKPPKKKWPRWKALAYGLISLVVGVSVAFIISYIIFLFS